MLHARLNKWVAILWAYQLSTFSCKPSDLIMRNIRDSVIHNSAWILANVSPRKLSILIVYMFLGSKYPVNTMKLSSTPRHTRNKSRTSSTQPMISSVLLIGHATWETALLLTFYKRVCIGWTHPNKFWFDFDNQSTGIIVFIVVVVIVNPVWWHNRFGMQ